LLIHGHDALIVDLVQRVLHHGHRALDNLLPGGDHRGRLLALQHRLGDLRRVGQRADPGFHDLQAGDGHPSRQLASQLLSDAFRGAPQCFLAGTRIVVGMRTGDVPQGRLGLHGDELAIVLDGEHAPSSVRHLPDHDRGDVDRVAVRIVDLQLAGFEIAHPH